MKFNKGIILFSFLILTTILNISNVKSTKVKRQESMMEYLHKFLTSDNSHKKKQPNNFSFKETEETIGEKSRKSEMSKLRKKMKHRTSVSEYEQYTNNTDTNNTATNNTASNKTIVYFRAGPPGINPNTTLRETNPNPILAEWFMISSKIFLNQQIFPDIININQPKMRIQIDSNEFRINGAYGNTLLKENLPNNKFFYFRLSGLNLFYSSTDTDINILGSIHIDSVSSVLYQEKQDASTEFLTTCFKVIDDKHNEYKICGMKEEVVKYWYCQLKSFLLQADSVYCPDNHLDPKLPPPKIIEHTIEITQPIVLVPLAQRMCNDNWNYQQDTIDWECDCKDGMEQSPIDLPETGKAIESEVKPQFEYTAVDIIKEDLHKTIEEANGIEGRLQIQYKENLLRIFADKFGRIVMMDGSIYHAEEINIHIPSEHQLNGKKYDMEVTILHSGVTQGDIARSASLSFLFERVPGKYNGFIESLDIFELPNSLEKTKALKNPIDISRIFQTSETDTVSSVIPFSFFTYQGSLTTPPCTEDTVVYVASAPLQIGSTALQLLQEATRIPDIMDSKGNIISNNWNNLNARPVQPLNGRPVFWFDHTKTCGPPAPKVKVSEGHYEKMRKSFTSYFFVNNDKPSGLPNAWVVSEGEAKGFGTWPNAGKDQPLK